MDTNKHECPKCGKPMIEMNSVLPDEKPGWPGLWICPDYREPINSTPPFKFKCDGMEVEDKAAEAFNKEVVKRINENAEMREICKWN